MPISRVRSVTAASMMFMIPMPPMSRLMAAIEISTMFHTMAAFLAFSRSSHGTTSSTSFICGWPTSMSRRTRSASRKHVLGAVGGDVDFRQFDGFGIRNRTAAAHDEIAELHLRCADGNVDVVVQIAADKRGAGAARKADRPKHADHAKHLVIDAELRPNGIVEGGRISARSRSRSPPPAFRCGGLHW